MPLPSGVWGPSPIHSHPTQPWTQSLQICQINPSLTLIIIFFHSRPFSKAYILKLVWRPHLDLQLFSSPHCSLLFLLSTSYIGLLSVSGLCLCGYGFHTVMFFLCGPLLSLSSLCRANSFPFFGHQLKHCFFRNIFKECPDRPVLCMCYARAKYLL